MEFKIGFESFQFMTKFGMCVSYYEFYKNASTLETYYYIKDLGNNAVCERAEAYQSTARSRIFLVCFMSFSNSRVDLIHGN